MPAADCAASRIGVGHQYLMHAVRGKVDDYSFFISDVGPGRGHVLFDDGQAATKALNHGGRICGCGWAGG